MDEEIPATIILPLLLGIASVAGVGGGSVVVPITIGLFHFSSKEAIAISTCIVFETAILRFTLFSAWTRHPENKEKTEIDYNTARIAFPIFLVGSYFGVILYILLADLWLTVIAVITLGITSTQMIFKSRAKFMAETKKFKAEAEKEKGTAMQPVANTERT